MTHSKNCKCEACECARRTRAAVPQSIPPLCLRADDAEFVQGFTASKEQVDRWMRLPKGTIQ